jgi:dTMP kinase
VTVRLIAVDGLDGCGKDTHAQRISALLESRGEKVVVISHPSRRMFGQLSKRALRRSGAPARLFATLFYTLDVLASVRWIKRHRGGTVVFVRYLMGTAYLPPRLAPLGYAFFRKLLPFPDLPLFIDIEPHVALERISRRKGAREMFETEERLVAVRQVALSLASREWVLVDNSEDGERSFAEVADILRSRGFA